MTLKELISADVTDLFFNLDEFGETHRIEGHKVDIVIDGDKLDELKAGSFLGIAEAELLFFARSADLAHVPRKAPGSLLNFDGREHLIVTWDENMGVSRVTLRQNRAM